MKTAKKKSWFAVIGRIPFDDEDSCYYYHVASPTQAEKRFINDLWRFSGRNDREDVEREHGAPAFINHVLSSSAKINIVWSRYD